MKNLLDELGFKECPLPMMTEFLKEALFANDHHYRFGTKRYLDFITQPLTDVIFDELFEQIDMPHMTLHQSCILADDKSTIEQIINSGIKLKLKP